MPKENTPSKGQIEPPSHPSTTLSSDETPKECLHQYDQSRQLIAQSLDPLTGPQGEGEIPTSSSRAQHDETKADLKEELLKDHGPPPTSRHSRSRPVVMATPHRNQVPTPHRRRSNATTASSSTEKNSIIDYSQFPESNFASSTDPSLGPDPHGEGVGFLPCEFVGYAHCDFRYDIEDTEQWMNHIIEGHLRCQLPKICACWFCDDYIFDTEVNRLDDMTNFRQRLSHIRDHIIHNGYGISDIRLDYNFLHHIWRLGMISQNTFIAATNFREGHDSTIVNNYRYDDVLAERQYIDDRSVGLVTIESSSKEKRRWRRDRRRNEDRPTLGNIEEQSVNSLPDSLSSTRTENAELKNSFQTTQRTSESHVSSSRNVLLNLNMLDEDGTHHDGNILMNKTGVLTEDSQSRVEDPRNPRLSPPDINELPGSHERETISDRNILNPEMDVENDVPALDPAAAGISSRQDIQVPTDSGYNSGLHPKAMELEDQDDKTWNNGLYSARTTYTGSNISTSEDRGYISEFAAELAQVGEQLNLSNVTAENILKVIPELLRAFALRVGYNENSAAHRDISVFVHRHRL
jgi:hypothetical protein